MKDKEQEKEVQDQERVQEIWTKNISKNQEIISSKPGTRVLEILEKCRITIEETKRIAYFCGYYSEGKLLSENNFLFLVDETFLVIGLEGITCLKNKRFLEDQSKIDDIRLKAAGLYVPPKTIVKSEKTVPKARFTREDCRIPYLELDGVDKDDPLWKKLEGIVNNLTRIENPEVVMPVLISSLLIPSAMTMNYPIIIFYGKSGTAKSGLIRLAENMYGIPQTGTTATYAGIRNHIQDFRYVTDEETGELIEQNILVTIDDIDSLTILSDRKLFGMLKTGHSYSTGTTRISTCEAGKNIAFNMACPKALSTCDQKVWTHPDLHELKRRVLIIPTKLRPDLRDELVDKEEINFNEGAMSLKFSVETFWVNKQETFKLNYRKGRGIDRELIATLATVYDISTKESKEWVRRYRTFIEPYVEKPNPAWTYLDKFIEEEEHKALLLIKKRISEGRKDYRLKCELKSGVIRKMLKEGVEEGIYDNISTQQIAQIMESKNYALERKGSVYYWVKSMDEDIDKDS